MKYEDMKRYDQRSILMPILIKLLQNLGGKTTRKELRNEIKSSVKEIPEEFIDETRPAKNGGTYRPFDFVFNFGVANLEMAGFIKRPNRGEIILTEKGRACNSEDIDVERDIYAFSDPMWKERRANKKNSNKVKIEEEDEEENSIKETEENDVSENWKEQLKQALINMSPKKFEIFCRALIKAMGVDIDDKKGVSETRDGGLDGFGYIVSDDFRTSRVAIQAKRWTNTRVGSPEINQFAGAMDLHNAEFGIFITTSDFSREAIENSRNRKRAITLINGDKIIELVEKYQLYVKPITTFQLEDFYFEEN